MASPTSSATSAEAPRRRRLLPTRLEWIIIVAVVGGLALAGGDAYVLEIPQRLLFGWYGFIQTNLQAMQPNWVLIAEGAVCTVLLGLGAHYFCKWLLGEWRARWTVLGLAGVLLLFVTGIAIIGITHQAAWLFTAKGPLLVDPWSTRFKVSEVLLSATEARSAVDAYYTRTGRLPENTAQTGIDPAGLRTSKYVKSMTIEGDGVVVIALVDALAPDGSIALVPRPKGSELEWKCASNLDRRQLPPACRD